ncbi:MFS transporter [Roseibium denhamense]|uniref:Predicted arabinose efflux permease, MFS family n=1 Tax=Roseibium denhamense TaxID=76305 RepID=A0ABY1P465_9HYPH|nr:MFS transporter [Roseibium denhamense]MTI05219.1 MFS transporter [Roseibium denhamense]SMP25584.1 Predicted arabinose efflux permease, MFS family [Roseibium denhamense]
MTPAAPTQRSGPNIPLVIACGCVIALVSFGPRSAMGLLFQPMTEARDWSRELFALAIAIQNLMWGLGQPFAGMMADRYGTWKTMTLGALMYAAGLLMMVDAQSAVALHVSAGVLVGLGIAFSSFSLVLAAFGRAVSAEQRSLAFGIGTASGSLGQFLFAPLGGTLIEHIGWQQTLIVFAGIIAIIPLLAIALRGRADGPSAAAIGPDQNLFAAMAEAFGTRGFILLTIGFFVCGFHVAFITVHLPPYIADLGLDPSWGATAIALIGLCNIAGSLAAGYIGGRYSKPIFLSLIYLARAVAIFIFIMVPVSPATVLIFSGVMGLLWLSTVPPTSGLVAVMFGPRYMATLFGFVFLSHQIGSFLGVWLGGKLYDETGSYDAIWWMGIALGIAAAIIHWPIQEKPVARLSQQAAE